MARAATDAALERCAAEDRRRIERHVSKFHQVWFLTSDGFGMKHLPRLVKRVIVQLCSSGKRRVITLDREGKRVLKKQSHCEPGHSRQKHPNDHLLTLNFRNDTLQQPESSMLGVAASHL
jgi:hypothetical protein